MVIRIASSTDLPEIAHIKSLYEQELGNVISNSNLSANTNYLIATDFEKIISVIFYERVDNLYQVPIVFTLNEHRNKNIATNLFHELIQIAKKNHISKIILWPSPKSISLYKKLGFTNNIDHYSLNIT